MNRSVFIVDITSHKRQGWAYSMEELKFAGGAPGGDGIEETAENQPNVNNLDF
jgi:hypothetical protein